MRFPVHLLLLACLLLSGCWSSTGLLLNTGNGFAGLQAGRYVSDPGNSPFRLMAFGGGWYEMQSAESVKFLFVEPLAGGALAVASADAPSCRFQPASCVWDYTPVRLSGGYVVEVEVSTPAAKAIARSNGARCGADNNDYTFTSRSGLLSALRQQASSGATRLTHRWVGG